MSVDYAIQKIRNQMAIDLNNAIDNDYKIIALNGKSGVGKSTIVGDEMLNRELNSLMLVNNQRLSFEMYNTGTKLAIKRGNMPLIHILHGKGYILSEDEQKELRKPECMCNLYKENINLFQIRDKGYLPDGFCNIIDYNLKNKKKYSCPYAYECEHKDQITRFFRLDKVNINKMILAPKSYVHTNIVDSYVDTFDNPNLIIDENSDSLYYDQLFLSPKIITNFKNFIEEILRGTKGLRYLWNDFKQILKAIQNAIEWENGTKDIHDNIVKFMKKEIKFDFKEDNNKNKNENENENLKKLIQWNEAIKAIIMYKSKHTNFKIGSAKNIIPKFIKIIENDNNKHEFKENMFVDSINRNFTYYINKIDHIRELANNVRRTILTDANTIKTNLKNIYPDLADSIKIINNSRRLNPKFRNVWIYRLNKERGAYGITTLINSRTKQFHDSFNNLAKILKDIIIYQAGEDRRIGLVISMQRVTKELQKRTSPIIEQTDSIVDFEYYYNIEGINKYQNVYWIVLFGSCNIPQEARNILSRFTNINEEQLEKLYGPKQMLQAAFRGRPNLRPNIIDLYSLSNSIAGYFKKEKDFKGVISIQYKNLLNYIFKLRGLFNQDVQKFLKCKSINTASDICKKLYWQGSLQSKQKINKKTNRQATFWYVKKNVI